MNRLGKGREERGSALLLVVFVTAVLLILGAALSGLAVTELRISANHEDSTRAFYAAEAGAEAALGVLLEEGMFQGPLEVALSEAGTASVAVTREGDGGVQVTSIGTSGNAAERVQLSIEPLPVPEVPADSVVGSQLGWYCAQTGFFSPRAENGSALRSSLPVLFATETAAGIAFEPGEGERRSFSAPALYFQDCPLALTVEAGHRLELEAAALVFEGRLEVSGELVLKNPEGVEEAGRVYFEAPVLQHGQPLQDRSGADLEGRAYSLPPGGARLPVEAHRLLPAFEVLWH